jgi:Tol biopolymer transport system component
MRRSLVAATVSVVATVSLVVTGAGNATFPGKNGVIAFTGQSEDVYTVNADGSDFTQVTETANSAAPVYTADGKTIFAQSKGSKLVTQIVYVSANGGKIHVIKGTTHGFTPTISASGERVAYYGYPEGVIRAVDANGKHNKVLTKNGFAPNFSPTGPTLALLRHDAKLNGNQVFTMDAQGQHVKQVTSIKDSDVNWPTWSPDGKSIIFSLGKKHPYDIWMVDADGSNLTQITDTPDADEDDPAISPDGKFIAYDDHGEIWVMGIDGSDPTQLTDHRADEYDPDWQPLP